MMPALGRELRRAGSWVTMRASRTGLTAGGVRSWLSRAVLCCLILRALIPTGYMPDFGATPAGAFKVVICSAAGTKTIALDRDGNPLPDRNDGHHGEPCAFGALAQAMSTAPDAAVAASPAYRIVAAADGTDAQLPPVRAGPVLGSRGPPRLS